MQVCTRSFSNAMASLKKFYISLLYNYILNEIEDSILTLTYDCSKNSQKFAQSPIPGKRSTLNLLRTPQYLGLFRLRHANLDFKTSSCEKGVSFGYDHRSSRSQMFFKIGVLKNFTSFTKKHQLKHFLKYFLKSYLVNS